MKLSSILLTAVMSIIVVGDVAGQAATWQPSQLPPFDFRNTAAVKIYSNDGGATVLGLVTAVPRTRLVTVTKTRMETRMRQVEDPQTGEKQEQTYQVQVPYTEQAEQTYMVRQRLEVAPEDAKVWTFRGQALTAKEIQTVLSSAKRCFYIANSYRKFNYRADPFFAEMLKPDVFVVWYDKTKATPLPSLPVKNE